MTSENPAVALRSILRAVMRDDAHVDKAWVELLGADVGTADFSLRHSEVVALWRQVYDLLAALPDDEDRKQYLSYMGHYYTAIVHPDPWSNAGSSVANSLIVDQLTGIAATLQYRALAAPPLGDDAVTRLRESITEWREILEEADFDEKFSTELRAQVDHLEWLLDNMTLLGSRPVAEASKKLVGTSLVAMAAKPSFAKRIGKATAAAVAFVTLLHTGVDQTLGVIEGVTEMQAAVEQLITPQKELEAPRDVKELTTGNDDDDVIDGEVVDDAPESPTPDDEAQG